MAAYYNENDKFAAAWLRNLIAAGHIAPGDVDERSIVDVQPDDLRGYTQCHFFAGIGGWSYALRLAEWPDDREVWSGSCPCQPLSCAGQRKGDADERHLWPAFYRLIAERKPSIVFGEQVAGKDGREWLAGIRADLEAATYACGCADLPACSAGAPHIRQRLWWVAHTNQTGRTLSSRGPGPETRAEERKLSAESVLQNGHQWHRPLPKLDESWLVDGISANVGAVRAYGNAIVPQVAEQFIRAARECLP